MSANRRYFHSLAAVVLLAAVSAGGGAYGLAEETVECFDSCSSFTTAAGRPAPAFAPEGEGVWLFCGWKADGKLLRPGDPIPKGVRHLQPHCAHLPLGGGPLPLAAAPADLPGRVLSVNVVAAQADGVRLSSELLAAAGGAQLCFSLGQTSFDLKLSFGPLPAELCVLPAADGPRLAGLTLLPAMRGELRLPADQIRGELLAVEKDGRIDLLRVPGGAQAAVPLPAAGGMLIKAAHTLQTDPGLFCETDSRSFAACGVLSQGDICRVPADCRVLGAVPVGDGRWQVDGSFSRVVVTETPLLVPPTAADGRLRLVLPAAGPLVVTGPALPELGSRPVLTVTDQYGRVLPGTVLLVNGEPYQTDARGRLVLPAVWNDIVITLPGQNRLSSVSARARVEMFI